MHGVHGCKVLFNTELPVLQASADTLQVTAFWSCLQVANVDKSFGCLTTWRAVVTMSTHRNSGQGHCCRCTEVTEQGCNAGRPALVDYWNEVLSNNSFTALLYPVQNTEAL